MKKARYHELYGLRLSTDRVLPGLASVRTGTLEDIQVRFGSLPPGVSKDAPPGSRIRPEDFTVEPAVYEPDTDAYFRMIFKDGTTFLIDRDGREVWAVWPSAATFEDAVTCLVGTVMGFVLTLRGVNCLHSSAALVDGRAVAFAGPAGMGKSTAAATFAKHGYPILADDIVALDDGGTDFFVRPGYPRVCLWPDAANRMFGSLPSLTPTCNKRYLDLQDGRYRFQDRPAGLAAIYLLTLSEPSEDLPRVEEVRRGDVLIQLVANSYMCYLLDREQRAREFEFLARVAKRVPVRRLIRARAWDRAERICDVVVRDLESGFASEEAGNGPRGPFGLSLGKGRRASR